MVEILITGALNFLIENRVFLFPWISWFPFIEPRAKCCTCTIGHAFHGTLQSMWMSRIPFKENNGTCILLAKYSWVRIKTSKYSRGLEELARFSQNVAEFWNRFFAFSPWRWPPIALRFVFFSSVWHIQDKLFTLYTLVQLVFLYDNFLFRTAADLKIEISASTCLSPTDLQKQRLPCRTIWQKWKPDPPYLITKYQLMK